MPGESQARRWNARGGVRRLAQAQALHHLLEALAVFGAVDGVRAGADDRHAGFFQGAADLQRVWPPNCTITPFGFCSTRTISSTSSSVTGSKYRRSEVS